MKVANSITRDAVPAGLFTGKRKQLYDFLYSRTRGSINPTRTAQLSWREIMKGANIGSDKTLREHLAHLRAAGLVAWEWETGSRAGSVYTVYLPEEVTTGTGSTSSTGSTAGTSSQNLPEVPQVENTSSTGSVNPTIQRTSENSKTSFKTNTEKNDDEPAAAMLIALKQAAKEITGREPSSSEADRWRELGELLATELRIAAGRTTVSSVPAFLTEHLRRRLWKKEKPQIEAEKAEGPKDASPAIDASQCPDCFGTGMWYPEGFEKGVARCRHERLAVQARSDG
jgi:hypothetical protein